MRAAVLLAAALAVLVATTALAQRALRADAARAVPRLRVDGAPLFALTGLQPGDRATRCLTVSARDAGRLSFFGGGENGALAPYVYVRILRGCNGNGVLFEGRLDRLPSERDAVADSAAANRVYRIEVTVLPGAPAGARATTSFGFGAGAVATCRAVRFARLVRRRGAATLVVKRLAGGRVSIVVRRRGRTLRARVNGVVRRRARLLAGRNTITAGRLRFRLDLRATVKGCVVR